jgi:aspartate aminotransferase, mitochondrial
LIIRAFYSSPPRHGSSIVRTILNDEGLKEQFHAEMKSMSSRIKKMRSALVETLAAVGSTHDWSHIQEQIGMFAFSGLTEPMCRQLTEEYSIFLTMNGRLSIAGLNESNIEYVAKAIHAVSEGKSLGEPGDAQQ